MWPPWRSRCRVFADSIDLQGNRDHLGGGRWSYRSPRWIHSGGPAGASARVTWAPPMHWRIGATAPAWDIHVVPLWPLPVLAVLATCGLDSCGSQGSPHSAGALRCVRLRPPRPCPRREVPRVRHSSGQLVLTYPSPAPLLLEILLPIVLGASTRRMMIRFRVGVRAGLRAGCRPGRPQHVPPPAP
jgi:hypothetical protein